MSSAAFAAPSIMTDEQMDTQVAGNSVIATVVNRAGKTIWSVTSLDGGPNGGPTGYNNGDNGNTEKTAPGLLNAAGNPIDLGRPGKGRGLCLNAC